MKITDLISSLSHIIEELILIVAVVEIVLLLSIGWQSRQHHLTILDTYRNTIKGLVDVPDNLLRKDTHSECSALFAYIDNQIKNNTADSHGIKRNISQQFERIKQYIWFPIKSSIGLDSSTDIPLNGDTRDDISPRQIELINGEINATDVTQAFVMAIDTTILGIFFAVVFMLWDSKITARIEKVVHDTQNAFELLTRGSEK